MQNKILTPFFFFCSQLFAFSGYTQTETVSSASYIDSKILEIQEEIEAPSFDEISDFFKSPKAYEAHCFKTSDEQVTPLEAEVFMPLLPTPNYYSIEFRQEELGSFSFNIESLIRPLNNDSEVTQSSNSAVTQAQAYSTTIDSMLSCLETDYGCSGFSTESTHLHPVQFEGDQKNITTSTKWLFYLNKESKELYAALEISYSIPKENFMGREVREIGFTSRFVCALVE